MTAPFSIAAILGNDETDSDVNVRLLNQNIGDFEQAAQIADCYAVGASDVYRGWSFIVSDARGERVKVSPCNA